MSDADRGQLLCVVSCYIGVTAGGHADLNARMAALQGDDEGSLDRRDAAATDSFLRGMLGHVPPKWNGGLAKTTSTSTVPSSTTCNTHLSAPTAPRVVVQTTSPASSSSCTSAKTSSSSTCTTTTSSPIHISTTCATSKSNTPGAVSTSAPCTTSTHPSVVAPAHTSTPCTTKTSSSAIHASAAIKISTTCTTKSSAVAAHTSTTCTTKSSAAAISTSTTCTTDAKTSIKSTSTCTTHLSSSIVTAKTTSTCTTSHTTAVASSKSIVPVVPVSLNKCPSCPGANNTVYRDHSNTAYNIRCNADNSAESYHTQSVGEGGYSQCFSWCSADKTCSGFTFSGGDGGSCYYKKNLPSKLYINTRLDNYITCAKQSQQLTPRQLPYLDSDSHFIESLSVVALVVFLIVAFLAWLRRRRRAQSKDYVRSHSHRRSVSNSSDEHAPIALPFHELAGGEGFVAVPPYGSAYAVPKHSKKDSQGNSVSVQPQPAQHHARQRSIYKGDGGTL